jgi:enamine deaminase RidA (YjgF/YER057c/UK114 family)
MNGIYDAWVPQGHCPVRYCVEAKFAREELLVEISIVAAEI